MFRWILTSGLILLALFFWYVTLTVPMISATAPALIAIVLTVAIVITWPKAHRFRVI